MRTDIALLRTVVDNKYLHLDYAGASPFRWSNYLANGNFSAAPEELFVLGNKVSKIWLNKSDA